MGRLEDECEGTLEFAEDGLDQFGKALPHCWLSVVDIFGQDCNCLGIGLALERVSAFLEDGAKGNGVGYDAVMDDDELGIGIGAERVTVDGGWRAVSSPASMSDRDLGQERLGGVHGRIGDLLAQTSDLSDLLEVVNLSWFVTIDANARRVVPTVFLTGEAIAEDLTNSLAVLIR